MKRDQRPTTNDQRRVNPLFARLLRQHAGLLLALGAGLLLRALLWGRLPRTGLISDEGEYLSAAHWLAQGRGFAWYAGYLWTRAPLYPLLLAAHLRLFGDALVPIYLTQAALSLLNVALVYALALRVQPVRRVAALAALLMAVYLPFALYTQVLLSETLYITLLLGGFLALAAGQPTTNHQLPITNYQSPITNYQLPPSLWSMLAAGALFGLATLTRSLTLGFAPIVALWLLGQRPTIQWRAGCLFTLAFCLCVAPWTVYNSRLYGGLVLVDTSGAYNLMLGARTAADGTRLDAPTRDFVRALLDPRVTTAQARTQLVAGTKDARGQVSGRACLLDRQDARLRAALGRAAAQQPRLPQVQVQQLLTAEGLCLVGTHPLAFAQKSLGELLDFFQINYSGDERFTDGFTTGRLPRWYALALFLLDDTLYMLTLPLAVAGWALARGQETGDRRQETGDRRQATGDRLKTQEGELKTHNSKLKTQEGELKTHNSKLITLLGLWFLYLIAVAPLLFAINRFRLPLLPFAFIFAASALVHLLGRRAARPASATNARRPRGLRVAYLVLALVLTGVALPSYIGTGWSSLWYTRLALGARQSYLATERLRQALHDGDAGAARTLISADLTREGRQVAPVLLLALDRRFDAALAALAASATQITREAAAQQRAVSDNDLVRIAVLRGDLWRSKGNAQTALAALTPEFVDKSNPVQWAWDWLHPAPTPEINIGGTLDLGYVEGCYLGEGGSDERGRALNVRWCGDGARLRFPAAGTGAPQTLTLRADGRGWPNDMLPVPPVRVLLGARAVGAFTPRHDAVAEFSVALPATPRGAEVVVTLRMPTFIPDAADYLSQQGPLVGQARRLGVRLDWARLH